MNWGIHVKGIFRGKNIRIIGKMYVDFLQKDKENA